MEELESKLKDAESLSEQREKKLRESDTITYSYREQLNKTKLEKLNLEKKIHQLSSAATVEISTIQDDPLTFFEFEKI